jgi:hypothetical protein
VLKCEVRRMALLKPSAFMTDRPTVAGQAKGAQAAPDVNVRKQISARIREGSQKKNLRSNPMHRRRISAIMFGRLRGWLRWKDLDRLCFRALFVL